MTTKVEHTEIYTDSQGEHTVCRGKLKLFTDINNFPEIGQIGQYFDERGRFLNNLNPFKRKADDCAVVIPIIYSQNEGRKIVFSYEFSPKHLQAIIDGKLKDGDEVFVECIETQGDWYTERELAFINVIKLNNGYIKLFPVAETWDNIIARAREKYVHCTDILQHIRENYYPPKHIK